LAFVIVELIENYFFVVAIAEFVMINSSSISNKGFFDFFVCLLAAASIIEVRIYLGRITYGQEERQQLNSIVVIVQNRLLFVLVA
jgi:uncharacterized membrane protein YjjP (DUF1212 family)